MPRIELIDQTLYDPTWPYFWEYDNLPLKNILRRQNLINSATDINSRILRESVGTQGTLSNRLAQSINEDGSLKISAMDEALHSIEAHTDTDDFVRMTFEERAKLDFIAEGATNLKIEVTTDTDVVLFDEGAITLIPSSTVSWSISNLNEISANLAFPAEAAHLHFYDQKPIALDEELIQFKINVSSTPFIDGTLRVYINGIRLSSEEEVYVPNILSIDTWTSLKFTPDPENGVFELSSSINENDIIRIDYDLAYIT